MATIAIDMDEVIADFVGKELELFNRLFHESITREELNGTSLRQLRPQYSDVLLYLRNTSGFFADFDVIPGARRAVRTLSKHHDIFITTAAMEFPNSVVDKYNWLKRYFDFIPELNYVFCGDKSIIHADYLIDDNSRHFTHFTGKGLLFSAPHNRYERIENRMNGWDDVLKFFGETN
jgi:Uncharacterized protein conserved in bacteria